MPSLVQVCAIGQVLHEGEARHLLLAPADGVHLKPISSSDETEARQFLLAAADGVHLKADIFER